MPPFISVVGYSNSGKTTFICGLLQELTSRAYTAVVIKHDPKGHGVYDVSGKDTYNFWESGAEAIFLSSPGQFLLRKKVEKEMMPEELSSLCKGVDLVILEGYKKFLYPSIQIISSKGAGASFAGQVLALICEDQDQYYCKNKDIACFGRDDFGGVVDLLENKEFLAKRRNKCEQ